MSRAFVVGICLYLVPNANTTITFESERVGKSMAYNYMKRAVLIAVLNVKAVFINSPL